MPNNYDSDKKIFLDEDGEVIIITPPDSVEEEEISSQYENEESPVLDNQEVQESKPVESDENKKIDGKRVLHFISSVVLYSILTILIIIFLMFVAYVVDQKIGQSKGEKRSPLFGAYVIISESMIPKINVNDAVVTMRVSEKNIHVNDIITFLSKDIETKGTPITHRVVGIVYEDNSKKVLGYRTKGDNNNTQDFALIKPDEVLGKVYLRIPKVGYIQSFISKPIGWVVCIVIPCLILIFSDTTKLIALTKKKDE